MTSPTRTLVDLATCLPERDLEAAVNEADKLDLVAPDSLRAILAEMGASRVPPRFAPSSLTFRLTDSELERRFLRLVRSAGLPVPETGVQLNGFQVDCCWPELGLVVETDGLRYHRTPSQQARDRRRDQLHTGAGLTALRFTHWQVRHEPAEVKAVLGRVIARLTDRRNAA